MVVRNRSKVESGSWKKPWFCPVRFAERRGPREVAIGRPSPSKRGVIPSALTGSHRAAMAEASSDEVSQLLHAWNNGDQARRTGRGADRVSGPAPQAELRCGMPIEPKHS